MKRKIKFQTFFRRVFIVLIFLALFAVSFFSTADPAVLFGYPPILNADKPVCIPTAKVTPSNAIMRTIGIQNEAAAMEEPRIVFEDHFDGEKIDASIWNTVAASFVPNNELQEYDPSCVSIGDGNLVLTAQKSSDGNFISGMVDTKGKLELTSGRIDVCMKLCSGQGLFPAAWLQCSSNEPNKYFEIDIMESLGSDPHTIYGVVHHKDGENKRFYSTYHVEEPREYHVYSVEWDTQKIQWFVDGFAYYSAEVATQPRPMYLVFNLAVGGNWPGSPDSSTAFPASISIDYVRIYAKEEDMIWF